MYEVVYYYYGRRNSVYYPTYAGAKAFWNYIRRKPAVKRAELIVRETA